MPKFIDRTGETNVATNGQIMTIIEYRTADDMDIQFEDGTIVYNKSYDKFKKGMVRNPSVKRKSINKLTEEQKKLNASFNTWYANHKDEYDCKEEAYNYYINNVKMNNSIGIGDKTYKSFRDMCFSNGVHPDTIKNFFSRGIAKELKLNIENMEHIILVINMYNNIRNKGIIIDGYKITNLKDIQSKLSDINICHRDILIHIYTIILYSSDLQRDIDEYIEKVKDNIEKINIDNDKRREKLEELRSKCIEAGIEIGSEEYIQVRKNKDNHKDWSIEKCIDYVINNEENRIKYQHKRETYKNFREEHNISKKEFSQISSYIRNEHKKGIDVSLLDALYHVRQYNKDIDKEWKDRWSKVVKSGVLKYAHRNSVIEYMKKHTDCTIEDIINHFMYEKREYKEYPKLKEYCSILKLNYASIVGYINKNDCTMEQAILHYRPDLYLNIFGELIIPEN